MQDFVHSQTCFFRDMFEIKILVQGFEGRCEHPFQARHCVVNGALLALFRLHVNRNQRNNIQGSIDPWPQGCGFVSQKAPAVTTTITEVTQSAQQKVNAEFRPSTVLLVLI